MSIPRSWGQPSPAVFTASDPNACDGHSVPTVLQIFRPGNRPDWQVIRGTQEVARVYQAEGEQQASEAAAQIAADRKGCFSGDIAVVTNLGIDPVQFLRLGVTSVMVEVYAEAGVVNTSIPRMRWQASTEGWPHIIPVVGVFDQWHLDLYVNFAGGGPNVPGNGGPPAFARMHWKGGPLGIYLGEGMSDTGSWVTYNQLLGS